MKKSVIAGIVAGTSVSIVLTLGIFGYQSHLDNMSKDAKDAGEAAMTKAAKIQTETQKDLDAIRWVNEKTEKIKQDQKRMARDHEEWMKIHSGYYDNPDSPSPKE